MFLFSPIWYQFDKQSTALQEPWLLYSSNDKILNAAIVLGTNVIICFCFTLIFVGTVIFFNGTIFLDNLTTASLLC